MVLNDLINAFKAFLNIFTGKSGFGNSLLNVAVTADFATRIADLKNRLENAQTETEKAQIEKELAGAHKVFNHYRGLMSEDFEAIAQSRDRLSRTLGTDAERSKHLFKPKIETDNFLKNKGDKFEIQVGRYFEGQGFFVFYNGMLRSEADQGVDLVVYDKHAREVQYIQCKNWEVMTLDCDDILTILRKMSSNRISPTRVEIARQQQAGWSIGIPFDDSVYYKIKYSLVVPKRESLTSDAIEQVAMGRATLPQAGTSPTLNVYFVDNKKLQKLQRFNL